MDETRRRPEKKTASSSVAVSALALAAGVFFLYVSWRFIFRDYMDSPFYIYAAFSAPAWLMGLFLVGFGTRRLRRDCGSHRA